MSKYGAKKVVIDGITFDSMAEGRRYVELRLLEKAGEISDLRLQVPFVLAKGVTLHGEERKRPAIRYLADFEYVTKDDYVIVEDVKGMDTPMGRLKRHLLKTVHGIDVRVIR